MNTRHLTHRPLHSRILVFAVALLGGLALTLGLLWTLAGGTTPIAAAPALDKAPSPAQEPAAKPLYRPLQTASGWTTRTEITIHYSGTLPLANYQISLTIPYSTGMRSDFYDLRFADGGNCLSHWVESITGTTATVWVRVPVIVSPTTLISMYYGNPSAPSASDGVNTFEFFDGFEDYTTDNPEEKNRWVKGDETGTEVTIRDVSGEKALYMEENSGNNNGVFLTSVDSFNPNEIVIEYRVMETGTHSTDIDYRINIGAASVAIGCSTASHETPHRLNPGDIIGTKLLVEDEWRKHIFRPVSKNLCSVYDGETLVSTHTHGTTSGKIQFSMNNNGDPDIAIDYIFVRQYASSAPTTTFGSATQIADLGVAKSVTPTVLANPGETITYTITFSSAGALPATGVVITDVAPVSVTNTHVVSSVSAGVVVTQTLRYVWEVSDLNPGQGGIITITGQLSSTLPGGHVFTNVVTGTTTAASDCPCNNSDAAATTINHAPMATASAFPITISLCYTGTLSGSGSDVEDASPALSYRWTQTGTTTADVANPYTTTTVFTTSCATPGDITFTLIVTDTRGLTGTADALVYAANIPVTGTWVVNDSPTVLSYTTRLTAGVAAGSSVTYTWDFGDGSPVESTGYDPRAQHVYSPTVGKRVFTYTAIVTASNTITAGGTATHTAVAATTIVTITTGWTVMRPVTIYNSGTSVLTDFQISLIVPHASGMQDDFSDLMFGGGGGNCLRHWIETFTPTTEATIWVQVPSIPTPTTTIYMYYGGPPAPSASNPAGIFEFFDDFEDYTTTSITETNRWVKIKDETGTELTIQDVSGKKALYIEENSGDNDGVYVDSADSFDPNKIVIGYSVMEVGSNDDLDFGVSIGGTPWCRIGSYVCGHECTHSLYRAAAGKKYLVNNEWRRHTFRPVSGDLCSVYDGEELTSASTHGTTWDKIRFGIGNGGNPDIAIDYVFVRQYASPAPTTTFGSEITVPDLIVTKAATPTHPTRGGPITYTITFSNAGSGAITGIVITDVVPVSVTVTGVASCCVAITDTTSSPPTYVWQVQDLAYGESGVITISGRLSSTLAEGDVFANPVAASTTAAGDCPCNNSDAVAVSVNRSPTGTLDMRPDNQNVSLCASGELTKTVISDIEDPASQLEHRWTVNTTPPTITIAHPLSLTTLFTVGCGALEGIYTFTLTITDTGGLTATPWITILAKNVPVEGAWITDSSTTTLGCTTCFTAGIQRGSSVTYTWDFGDGFIATTGHDPHVQHVYTVCGTIGHYTATIIASNGFYTGTGYQTYVSTDTTIVTITNEPPVADAGPPQRVVVDALATLGGGGSYDPDYPCHDIEYYWEQTGGIVTATLSDSSAVSPTFTAPQALTMPTVLTFTLAVTDTGCLTATAVTSVTVVLPVGGYTEPVSALPLSWSQIALVAAIGAASVFVAAVFRKRRKGQVITWK